MLAFLLYGAVACGKWWWSCGEGNLKGTGHAGTHSVGGILHEVFLQFG